MIFSPSSRHFLLALIAVSITLSFSEDLDYETYGNNYFNLLNDLKKLLKKDVDLIAEKTLKNPYLIESINEHKIQLI